MLLFPSMSDTNKHIPEKFLSAYNPKESEDAIYKLWENSGYFNPDTCIEKKITDADAEHFSIVLPPPNVTGTLHMGHASMLSVEDILVRYNRMLGKRTLWIPGTDHAAIATQSKVEKEIYKKEKKSRYDLGREELLKRIGEFAQESHDTIVNQVKKIGASLDWSREAFTLDTQRTKAVYTAFKNMYDAGLIYQGGRTVNWDPKGQTVISDDEIVYKEMTDKFYTFKYGPFEIGTARPETKFGDKYVVMHPDDKRYEQYKHGQQIDLEWINGPITATIIKDEAIDMEFGTGVMTITPWHSAIDFEIAQRHGLDVEQVIDKYGKLLPIAGEFEGQKISVARDAIVEKLKEKGLLVSVDENYVHNVATAERTGGMIEPQIMKQWFIDTNKEFALSDSKIDGIQSGETTTLKKLMRHVVETKQINILPSRFEKDYYRWIDNLRPWCISRQIWYGHRIPVWYKGDEVFVGLEAPEGDGWEQDPDTLDTWFSSGLWTFSTLGWPDDTADLRNYHPTTVLETGYDILFFWVARMILMSGFNMGSIPFKNVYLHGLVRDEKGKKMSKSLGNIIDPLDMIEKYGADAARLSLIIGAAVGNDLKLSEHRIKGYKHFANKIWNITRFVLENTLEADLSENPTLTTEDEKHQKALDEVVAHITDSIEHFRIDIAADEVYHYIWHEFADKILEESKPILQNGTPKEVQSRQWLLYHILTTSLKLLHPFMPFVTEEIWQSLPQKDTDILMVAKWPRV